MQSRYSELDAAWPVGLCRCGCGQETALVRRSSASQGYKVGDHRRFLTGHHRRTNTPDSYVVATPGLCACGCGAATKKMFPTSPTSRFNRFVLGHDTTTIFAHMVPPNPSGLCMCGCGEVTPIARLTCAKLGNVRGHHTPCIVGHQRPKPKPVLYLPEDRGYATPCWIWQRCRNKLGYGRVSLPRRLTVGRSHGQNAHVYMWEQVHGPVPPGLVMDHLCRVPSCVNPDHLEPVTNAENVRRGKRAKLSHAQANVIRSSSEKARVLAERYSVNESVIYRIRRGTRWSEGQQETNELPEPAPYVLSDYGERSQW
jgi:hypothetical protein